MPTYECWEGGDDLCRELTFTESGAHQELLKDSKLLYQFEATHWEAAMVEHHKRQGFEPYVPEGEVEPCPNNCGATYYPEGSGQCPNCGLIG